MRRYALIPKFSNLMATEITVLDFKLSNTFEEYCTHMKAPEQQAMFKEMGVKTFYIGQCKDDPKRATVMFEGPENVLYDIFTNPETKPIVRHPVIFMSQQP